MVKGMAMAVENPFSTVVKVLSLQVLVGLICGLIALWKGSYYHAFSALIGGGIAILPNVVFAMKIYLVREQSAHSIVNAFYIGETLKLVLTVALFAIVIKSVAVDFFTLLLAYAAVLSVFWFALFYWRN